MALALFFDVSLPVIGKARVRGISGTDAPKIINPKPLNATP